MKIAFSTLACPQWDLDTLLARAKEYGYDGIDFRGLGEELEVYRLPAFNESATDTKQRIADAGLKVAAFSSSARMFDAFDKARQKSLRDVARYADLCRVFGVRTIRIFGGLLEGVPREEAVAISVDALEHMAAIASPAYVAVETHDDWVTTAPLAAVLKKVTAKNVGVVWDLHHPFRLGGEDPQQTYDNIGPFTRYVHVKDSIPAAGGGHTPALPGEGDVPLAKLIHMLRDGGYKGWFTVEWEKRWRGDIADPETALPAYATWLRGLKK